MTHELVIKGGDVVHIGRCDIGVTRGRIAELGQGLAGREVVDVQGKLVTPGLVDLHTHVFDKATYWGIDAGAVAWYTGVTTWVDAGSAGAYTFDAMPPRVPAFLNISAVGLTAPAGESRDLSHCDVELAIATALAHPGRIVGIKVRMDRHNASGLEPLRRAIHVGEACGLPVMVHIGAPPPSVGDIVPLLRPGDIITHCASGQPADPGALTEAYRKGVIFDLGHGAGSFAFHVLEAQLEAGMPPHTVSSDLHARCLYGPVFDLPTTMAKMLAVGMPLAEVIDATTVRPASVVGLDRGTLTVGAPADIAVFTLQEGRFPLSDVHGQIRVAPMRLRNEMTFVDGRLLPPRLPSAPPRWIPLSAAQRDALAQRERAVRDLLTTPLVGAEGLDEQFPRAR
ncbi:amidohydrolase family protein [Allorhizocola rhizosphaerae]|uniref:amidohydrolase family protein n=1 Tax=Allorhizocola rhizosphaerae TaxID=1872709 RepID=UPI000E3C7BEE|nr:amidohydrolase/deacetylase family metallohydrolase [Allorhizocola rhizosphaerae]